MMNAIAESFLEMSKDEQLIMLAAILKLDKESNSVKVKLDELPSDEELEEFKQFLKYRMEFPELN